MALQPFFVIPEPWTFVSGQPTVTGRPWSHLGEYLYPGMIWQHAGPIIPLVAADMGQVKTVDFAAMLGASGVENDRFFRVRMDDNTASINGGVVPFEYQVPFKTPTPIPDTELSNSFADFPSPQTYRYFGIWLTGGVAVAPISAMFLVIGRKITFSRYAEHDWEIGVDDLSTVTMTRGLVPDIADGGKLRTISFTMKWVSEAEYYEKVAPLDMALGRSQPVYLCFDPEPTPRRQAMTFFGLLKENPRNKRANARAFERRFDLVSFI